MTTIPEPPNGTALYWPKDRGLFARLVIRDDAAAEATDQEPGAHWFAPNSQDTGITWDVFCNVVNTGLFANPIEDAVLLARPEDHPAEIAAGAGEAAALDTPAAAGAPAGPGAPAHDPDAPPYRSPFAFRAERRWAP